MELRQLRTFQCVAEFGSLSRAADRLHIAQPALSRQIKQLEAELKSTLFIRNGRGMLLTDAGRLLLERVGGLVRQVERVADDISSLGRAPTGSVALGIIPTVSYALAGGLAVRVAKEAPSVSLRIVESYGGHLVDWLHRGEIDAAIIFGQEGGLSLHQEQLAVDELMLVGPRGSGVAAKSDGALAWLAKQPLVLPSKSHGLRQVVERVAQRRNLQLQVITEADSFRVLVDLVERGLGYTVLPPSAIVRELERNSLEAVLLKDPRVVRHIVVARSPSSPPSLAVQAVVALVRKEALTVAKAGLWKLATPAAESAQARQPSTKRRRRDS